MGQERLQRIRTRDHAVDRVHLGGPGDSDALLVRAPDGRSRTCHPERLMTHTPACTPGEPTDLDTVRYQRAGPQISDVAGGQLMAAVNAIHTALLPGG